jgi:hypothetical protein
MVKLIHITNNMHDTNVCHSLNISLETVTTGNVMIYLGLPINIPPSMCCYITQKRLTKTTAAVRETMVKGTDEEWPMQKMQSPG